MFCPQSPHNFAPNRRSYSSKHTSCACPLPGPRLRLLLHRQQSVMKCSIVPALPCSKKTENGIMRQVNYNDRLSQEQRVHKPLPSVSESTHMLFWQLPQYMMQSLHTWLPHMSQKAQHLSHARVSDDAQNSLHPSQAGLSQTLHAFTSSERAWHKLHSAMAWCPVRRINTICQPRGHSKTPFTCFSPRYVWQSAIRADGIHTAPATRAEKHSVSIIPWDARRVEKWSAWITSWSAKSAWA